MGSVYSADDWETEVVRKTFGPTVAEVVFYDAEFPAEAGHMFELVIATDRDGREIGRRTPADADWNPGAAGLGAIAAGRGETVKFWLSVPQRAEMQRIGNARELRKLADKLGVRKDWHEPGEQELTARIEGESFDNTGIWPPSEVRTPGWSGELCVILSRDGEDIAVVNLADLLAMASYPDGPLR